MVRLTGRQATNYQGVQASSPPNFGTYNRPPTTTDWQNFYLGDLWEVNNRAIPQDLFVYILVSLRNNIATWVRFAGGTGSLLSLTSNTGGTVFGDALGNINTIGDGTTITGVGNPGTNTITFSVIGGRAASQFVASNVTTPTGLGGTATPILGVINVQANHNLNASAGTPNTGAVNDIVYWTTNASTWGDLVSLTAGNFAVQAFTGDITITANNNVGNFNLPVTDISGDAGVITQGGTGFLNRVFHTYGLNNLFLGTSCGNLTLTTASAVNNIGIGDGGVLATLTTGQNNVAIGANSSLAMTTGINNVGVGQASNQAVTSGTGNTAVGSGSLAAVNTGGNNCGFGLLSGHSITTGSGNHAIGVGSSAFLTTGSSNISIGVNALSNLLTGSNNIILGETAGTNYTGAESSNITIGKNVFGVIGESNIIRISTSVNTGDHNIFIGQNSPGSTVTLGTGVWNTCVGSGSFRVLTTGNENTAMGYLSLASVTTGEALTAVGYASLQNMINGTDCVAFGVGAMNTATSGTHNTAIGVNALDFLVSGSYNTAIGTNAGGSYTGAESSNVILGENGGVLGESNTIRIGGFVTGTGNAQQNRCFIAGIRGITTGVNNAIAVLIDSAGQLGTVSSSLRYKDNIQDMFHHSSDIYNLRPVVFTYKEQSKMSYGLIAEEVVDAMPGLVVYNDNKEPETVKYLDLIPMLLNEIQKLNKRINNIEKKGCCGKFNI